MEIKITVKKPKASTASDKKKKYEPPSIIDLKVDYTQATGASRCWNGAAQGWQCQPGSGAGHQCMGGWRAGHKCMSGSSAQW